MDEITVVIHGDTWKLVDIQEDIDWCKAQDWSSATYTRNGDHHHCSICWWTLNVSADPAIGNGYVTGTNSRVWLCTECFDQFIILL